MQYRPLWDNNPITFIYVFIKISLHFFKTKNTTTNNTPVTHNKKAKLKSINNKKGQCIFNNMLRFVHTWIFHLTCSCCCSSWMSSCLYVRARGAGVGFSLGVWWGSLWGLPPGSGHLLHSCSRLGVLLRPGPPLLVSTTRPSSWGRGQHFPKEVRTELV